MKWINNYLNNYRNIPGQSWRLLSLGLIEAMGGGLGFFISLYFKAYLSFPMLIIGKILSCYGLGTVIGGWLGGLMIDKWSAAYTNVTSLILFGISFIFLAFLNQPIPIALIMFFMGCASYGFIASNSVLVMRTANQNESLRLKLLNLKNVASNIGMGLAATLLAIYGHHSFHLVFITMGFVLLAAAGYQFYLQWNITEPKTQSANNNNLEPTSSQKLFYVTLVCVFSVGLIVMQHKMAYPIFVKATFSSPIILALIFALNPLIIIFFQPMIVNFTGRYNKITMMGLGAIGLSIGMIILNISSGLVIFLCSVFFYTIGEMLFFSLSQLLCYQSQSENKKGNSLGMWRVAYATSSIVGPYCGGIIYQVMGANTIWLICGILGLFCYSLTCYLQFDAKLKLLYRIGERSLTTRTV